MLWLPAARGLGFAELPLGKNRVYVLRVGDRLPGSGRQADKGQKKQAYEGSETHEVHHSMQRPSRLIDVSRPSGACDGGLLFLTGFTR